MDVALIHDPQPAALRRLAPGAARRWIWRCHIDTSEPEAGAWAYLRPVVEDYDRAVFTLAEFVPPDLDRPVDLIPPAIDPLSSKNAELAEAEARRVVARFALDPRRPVVVQVARFDPWKDPVGVIAAFERARRRVPEAQLALVGSLATDDPEGWAILERVSERAGDVPGSVVLSNLDGVGPHEVNAFQRAADVAVQKSLREGFGLMVSEALWKGTPVVGGRAGASRSHPARGRRQLPTGDRQSPRQGAKSLALEAIRAGRRAIGIELESRWAALATANLALAREQGATGGAGVIEGDAPRAAAAARAKGAAPAVRTEGARDGTLFFADDLLASLADGDAAYAGFLDLVDDYVARERLAVPEDPAARARLATPFQLPVRRLDLSAAGIGAVIWSTGYGFDLGWIDLPVLDAAGAPRHSQGITDVPGLYFLGLQWLSRMRSSYLSGVGDDAARLADHIVSRSFQLTAGGAPSR